MLRHKDVLPDSIIAIPDIVMTEAAKKGFELQMVPLPGHMGITRDDFPKVCRRLGIRAARTVLVATKYIQPALYKIDASKAWSEAAAFFQMMRTGQVPSDADPKKIAAYERGIRKKLEQALERRQEAQAQINRLKITGEEVKCGQDFDGLMANPDIDHIEIDDTKLVIYTKKMKMKNVNSKRSAMRELGRVKITIETRTSNFYKPGFHNLDHRPGGWDHPHVDEGNPCLGNVSGTMSKFHREGNFVALVGLCLEYLRWYNPHSGVKSASGWPRADGKSD